MLDPRLRSVESVDRIVAQAIAEKYFGIQASAHELPSERDQNFLLTDRDGEKFVLKIANRNEKREVLEAQNAMLGHLAGKVSFCPRVVASLSGERIVIAAMQGCAKRFVRVVRYLPGVPLASVEQSDELLRDLGRKLGQLDRSLQDFDHPGAHREFHWDLAQGVQVVRQFGTGIKADWLRDLVLGFRFGSLNHLRKSVIHGDANDYNVLVEGDEVVGLIDFGDIVYSYTVGDLAIAVAYVMLGKADPYAAAAPVIAGYVREFPLTNEELDSLWTLVRLRLCMSVSIAAYQQAQQPENEYLGVSQRLIVETLPRLIN
jgi:Ser/Thr protein kinase RdoA (MazF antagonist)